MTDPTIDEERKNLEAKLFDRLQQEAARAVLFPSSRGGLHLWELGYGKPEVELALYRMRKAGLLIYDRNRQLWRVR